MTVKEQAVAMRREKKSYREIHSALGVPKGTLSGWFNGSPWSEEVRRDLEAATRPASRARITAMSRARSVKFAALRQEARREARESFPVRIQDPLFIAGIALYWGEGDKHFENGHVRMSNIDAMLLRTFQLFLLVHGDIMRERLRVGVLVYPELDADHCVRYWSQQLALPISQFHKTQVIPGRSKRRKLPYGVCMLIVGSRLLAERIDEWTHCLAELLVVRPSSTINPRAGIV